MTVLNTKKWFSLAFAGLISVGCMGVSAEAFAQDSAEPATRVLRTPAVSAPAPAPGPQARPDDRDNHRDNNYGAPRPQQNNQMGAPRPQQNNQMGAPRPQYNDHMGAPRPQYNDHMGAPRPNMVAHRPPRTHQYYDEGYVTVPSQPVSAYSSAVGGIIGGSLMMALGAGLGIAAIVVDTHDDDDLWDETGRTAVGATGGVIFVLGAIVTGVSGYKLHEINTADGDISMYIAPTLGGAMFEMTF